jgi:hypothetical protein
MGLSGKNRGLACMCSGVAFITCETLTEKMHLPEQVKLEDKLYHRLCSLSRSSSVQSIREFRSMSMDSGIGIKNRIHVTHVTCNRRRGTSQKESTCSQTISRMLGC